MEYIGYFASIIIGISLGLIGGGGSIITVPVLVYLFHIKPELATSYSLFIVGTTAMVGTAKQYRMGNLKVQTALYFALPSILSLLFVRKIIIPLIPEVIYSSESFELSKGFLIMVTFAVLMIAASLSMIRSRKVTVEAEQPIKIFQLVTIGLIVGAVTGFLGAGGGFLIIPALLFFANLSMKQAVGTSLFIIFINSTIGFIGDMVSGVQIDYTVLIRITIMAVIGMFIGTALSKKIEGNKLKPIFGWFVLIMGIYIIGSEIYF